MGKAMNTTTARELANDFIGADPVIAVTSDAFGLVVQAQDIDLGTLKDFVKSALFDSRTYISSGPNYSVARGGDRVTVRFEGRDADEFDNAEQWRYYNQIREVLMGRTGAPFSVAQRIESWLGRVVSIRIQDIPLGRVAID